MSFFPSLTSLKKASDQISLICFPSLILGLDNKNGYFSFWFQILGSHGRNDGGLSPSAAPKSAANQALLIGRNDYPKDGYIRAANEEHDDDDENQLHDRKLFSKSSKFVRYFQNQILQTLIKILDIINIDPQWNNILSFDSQETKRR